MGCVILPALHIKGQGGLIRLARESRGVSADGLAHFLGLELSQLRKIEAEQVKANTKVLEVIAKHLDYPMAFFDQEQVELAQSGASPMFLCGRDATKDAKGIVACRFCNQLADYLCDYPIGEGKTCDLPICEVHRIAQGGDVAEIDFCPTHSIIARGLAQ